MNLDQALCTGRTDEWFSDDPEVITRAIRVCQSCPLLHECRASGLSNKERHGVWGGVHMPTYNNL